MHRLWIYSDMSQEEVDQYRKGLLLFNDELLEAVRDELKGHIEFIEAELNKRKQKK
jgi:hypothetical protein